MTIKEAREKRGLTQQQVSDMTGVPRRSIQNWEAGIRKCPDYVERMLVDALDRDKHIAFLNDLLTMMQRDLENIESHEAKKYIEIVISDITNHLKK